MLLSAIKILILEDSQDDINLIKEGLFCLQRDGMDKFDKKLIFEYQVKNNDADVADIYRSFKQQIVDENIDVLFIDLNLLNSYEDGLNIIKNLVNDDNPEIKNIPKYILSSQNIKGTEIYKNVEQFTNLFIQKPTSDRSYEECFIDANIIETLPILVDMYREIKKSFRLDVSLNNINTILQDIKTDTASIKERTLLIENMNQTMIKLMPLTIPEEKQKKELKKFITDDMSKYLVIDTDGFFSEDKMKNSFVEEVSKQFDEIVQAGFRKETWNLLKDAIKSVAQTQGIEEDNAGLCAVKLIYRAYSQATQLVRGEG